MAIFTGALLALATQSSLTDAGFFALPMPAFFAAAFVLMLVGAWDDYKDLPAVTRLLAQVLACLIMILRI